MSEENKREDGSEASETSAAAKETAETPATAEATKESAATPVASEAAAAAATPAPTDAATAPASPDGVAPEGAAPAPTRRVETDEEKAARRKAAVEAKEAAKAAAAQAAAEAAKAAQSGQTSAATAAATGASTEGKPAETAAAEPPKPPSHNQPKLDRAVALLKEILAEDAVVEAYINEPNDHLPTLVVNNAHWLQAAQLFRSHAELNCNYLRNVSGVDYETHMEVVYYPLSLDSKDVYCLKVRTDREQPSIPSVTPIWETANWNEREIYDLLGIDFPGHPDLRRIMMPDDWVGHPLRKDYVPLDPEV